MKLGFISLGCPKNLVDGEVMLGLAREAGHEITRDASSAEVIVVNTCAFIDTAKEESIDAILEMAELKRQGSCKKLVVTGCLAERYRDQLRAEIPEIDVVLGTGEVPEITRAIDGTQPAAAPVTLFRSRAAVPDHTEPRNPNPGTRTPEPRNPGTRTPEPRNPGTRTPGPRNPGTRTPEPRNPGTQPRNPGTPEPRDPRTPEPPDREGREPTYLYDSSTPRLLTTPSHYAYVKVAEGCDYSCAFCIIPTLRGHYRSRDEASIVDEATKLARQGVRELLLISQDTTFFGIDRGEPGALARLLRRLNDVPDLEWIRLLYLYPTTITDDVLDAMADCGKVCKYIDLPLQHASADVLRRMRRPGNGDAYRRLLARTRARVPGVTLRTTFIVGFPGETEQDFAELCDFIREIEFDHVGVFTYSHEEGTRAHALDDDIPAATKQARRNRLLALQQGIVARRQKARIGEIFRVLVDGPASESELVLTGRLEGQAPDIDSIVYFDAIDPSTLKAGDIVAARVTGARGYDLIATVAR